MELKPGARLRSATDSTEVVVVRAPSEPVDLRCGGHPMVALDAAPTGPLAIEPGFGDGTLVGKRYGADDAGLEVLCTRAGPGSISVGTEVLRPRGAKPLPSSD